MKTVEEYRDEWLRGCLKDPKYDDREFLDHTLREVWQSATKAQMHLDEYSTHTGKKWETIPFPGDPT